MNNKNLNTKISPLFNLHGLKAAKVSEISEATASSPVAPEERVNFHIGNPVQDNRLEERYLRMLLQLDSDKQYSGGVEGIIKELELPVDKKAYVQFLRDAVTRSIPYMPRGGFNKRSPNKLIKIFENWITKQQQEPLYYDLGENSGNRECIIASGGKIEAIRVLFHSLSKYLKNLPAQIFSIDTEIPSFLTEFKGLHINPQKNDADITAVLKKYFKDSEDKTTAFLLLGSILDEKIRREIRLLSLEHPIMIVELNDAPNHLSLAREAIMMNRVIRFITPSALAEKKLDTSIIFAAGNADYLKVFETIHFQLKGTPSASEVTLLEYILDKNLKVDQSVMREEVQDGNYDNIPGNSGSWLDDISTEYENKIFTITEKYNEKVRVKTDYLNELSSRVSSNLLSTVKNNVLLSDKFLALSTEELIDELLLNINNSSWLDDLEESFLSVFAKEHPEYEPENCTVVSGSSRTALGLLGFHCGIKEVIGCDLSWTYEHCFPKVEIQPVEEDLGINKNAIISAVQEKLNKNPNWQRNGAVAVNNPHNASGKVFSEEEQKELIKWLLIKNIYVIDDLAYQNVLPKDSLKGPKTVKQIALELVQDGQIFSEQLSNVITVHSLSKTDCFAGARLAVAEVNDEKLLESFRDKMRHVKMNSAAVLMAYLFYRNDDLKINTFWKLRNRIFKEKMDALNKAIEELPAERNLFNIVIKEPEGSMYPQMIIEKLPAGLSLDWLSSGLASQGIGLVPLSTFARTSKGFEIARKSFRLTLGGGDGAEQMLRKTRRVLIDLNRMIAEEKSRYNVKKLSLLDGKSKSDRFRENAVDIWRKFEKQLYEAVDKQIKRYRKLLFQYNHSVNPLELLKKHHLPERLSVYEVLLKERAEITYDNLMLLNSGNKKRYAESLEYELYKDDLILRKERFQNRLYDRTVHPTQMYSLSVDRLFNNAIDSILKNGTYSNPLLQELSHELLEEFLGRNAAIDSIAEADELVADLNSLLESELYTDLYSNNKQQAFLSFWGDWDGSSRPSGQGHRLVAAALIENVNQLSRIIEVLREVDPEAKIDQELLNQIDHLPGKNQKFWKLLHDITALTNQLEQRYRSVLPFSVESGFLRKIGMRLGIASDPLTKLWQHNDSLERKMLSLRQERSDSLEYYFALNKKLRKTLYSLIPRIVQNSKIEKLSIEAGFYKDLLKRFALTPRIHQKLITSRDQFAINTTVHNIIEINEISGKYGNPGMVLGLQVSMSDEPQALISLDRKLNSEKEKALRRNNNGGSLASVWSIPLFEDIKTVKNVKNYLDKIWEYASQSRQLNQTTQDRLSSILCEVFVAGSDLSQQVGQLTSSTLYNQAKYDIVYWLAEKGLTSSVRMKLGSGEPMQRQGGYYAPNSGKNGFISNNQNFKRLKEHLKDSTIKSTEYAKTPLQGVYAGGDLRTFQSNISEQLRQLPVSELSELLNHIKESQNFYSQELLRASEPFVATRLQFQAKGMKELERLTFGKKDEIYDKFLELAKNNFQNILYGKEEDVVGIHVVSYFISRTTPPLRDRPTVRPSKGGSDSKGQKILKKIADTIPLSKHGSLLRAIGHNRAQTMILGVNQLTTGLFRALEEFKDTKYSGGDGSAVLQDRILPNLPVYEILHTIRIYQDCELHYLDKMLDVFPAGNSAIGALKEDIDSMYKVIPLLQSELLRRHGISVNEFFDDEGFIVELLPTLRPDLAVLLQPDLFNTDMNGITKNIKGTIDEEWLTEFDELLNLPGRIGVWRKKIWELLEDPVREQVKSFIELSVALYSLSKDIDTADIRLSQSSIKKQKFETSLTDLLKGKMDDSMRQFLSAAVQYLTRLPEDMIEVPIDIIRALKDVERILRIEEQALNEKDQDLLKYYILQTARLVGENG